VTVVAAATDGRTVWMATDSQSSENGGRIWTVDKLRRIPVGRHGTSVFAAAGDHRLVPLARHLAAPFEPDPHSDGDCDGWAQAIAEAWTQLACEAAPPVTDDDGLVSGYAILGYAGRIWTVMTNVADQVRDGYASIGSGGELALGILAATEAPLEDRVRQAVTFACRHHDGCSLPASTLHTPWPEDRSAPATSR
jgi:hypothetical protein